MRFAEQCVTKQPRNINKNSWTWIVGCTPILISTEVIIPVPVNQNISIPITDVLIVLGKISRCFIINIFCLINQNDHFGNKKKNIDSKWCNSRILMSTYGANFLPKQVVQKRQTKGQLAKQTDSQLSVVQNERVIHLKVHEEFRVQRIIVLFSLQATEVIRLWAAAPPTPLHPLEQTAWEYFASSTANVNKITFYSLSYAYETTMY